MKRKKFLTALLSAAMMLTAIVPGTAFADELPMNSYTAAGQGSVICQASVDANFLVKLPVAVTLNNDQAFSMPVQVSGDLVKGDTVTVTPAASVTMEYMTADTDHKKQSIVGTVSAGKTEFPFEELFNGNVVKDASTTVMVSGLTAGTWQGQLGYEINLNKNGGKKTESAGLYTPSNTFVAWDDLMSEGKIVVTENKITSADKSLSGRLNISDEIENIGDNSLSQTPGLTDVTIPDTVTSIGDSAFEGDTGLTTIKVPDSVTSIGNGAFKDCTNLKYAKLPDKLTDIPNNVFEGDSTLAKDNIIYNGTASGKPWGATGTTDSTGGSTSGSDSKKDDTGDVQTQAAGLYGVNENSELDGSFTSWDELVNDGYFTIENGELAFNRSKRSDLKGKLVISNKVTSLKENNAFDFCQNLTEVYIPGTIKTIETGSFSNDSKLSKVTLGDGVESIDRAFSNCSNLSYLYIPASLTDLGTTFTEEIYGSGEYTPYYNFDTIIVDDNNPVYDSRENCNAIIQTSSNKLLVGSNNTIIPDTVTQIGEFAFRGRTSLTEANIPNGVEYIGAYAFLGCTSLTNISIPSSVSLIGHGIINRTNATVTINSNNTCYKNNTENNAIIETTESKLISGNNSLTEIPAEVAKIGEYALAFSQCTTLSIPSSVNSIGDNAFEKADFTSVTIKKGVTSIGSYAFAYCKKLTSVAIPDSITRIEYGAFEDCTNLSEFVMPNSVTVIGENAFNDCYSLTSVVLSNNLTSIGDSVFYGCSSITTIYYSGSLSSDTNWGATNATIEANNTVA